MKVLKNTWKVLTRKEKKQFIVLLALDVIVNVIDILSLALLLALVQLYIQPSHSVLLSFLPAQWIDPSNITAIAIFFMFFILKNIAAVAVSSRQFRFTGDVAVRLSGLQLSCYQQASFDEYTRIDSSVQIRKIGFQPFEFCQYLLSGIQQLITQTFLIVLTTSAILLFNAWLFFLLLLILLPPVTIVFFLIRKRLNTTRTGIRTSNERSFQYLLDALKGYIESNIYHRNEFFKQRFLHYRKKFSDHLFQSLAIQAVPARALEVFAVMGLFILILLAQWSGNDKNTLLTIGAFMAAAYKVIPGIVKMMNVSGQMRAYGSSLHELVKQIETGQADEIGDHTINISSIGFNALSFQYDDRPILQRFSYNVRQGDFAGIHGASGRGKTTLFNLLLGFLEPATGEIQVNDKSVDTAGLKRYWPSIAYIRQQSFLINDTILKNITFEEEEPDRDRLKLALRISGLAELLLQFPEGIDRMISENGKNISGGQQQRIAIARALYKDAQIFLLDEPFNELDENAEAILLQHFRQLADDGKIVIMITHDKKSLSYCNKIITLDT